MKTDEIKQAADAIVNKFMPYAFLNYYDSVDPNEQVNNATRCAIESVKMQIDLLNGLPIEPTTELREYKSILSELESRVTNL